MAVALASSVSVPEGTAFLSTSFFKKYITVSTEKKIAKALTSAIVMKNKKQRIVPIAITGIIRPPGIVKLPAAANDFLYRNTIVAAATPKYTSSIDELANTANCLNPPDEASIVATIQYTMMDQ